jgi:hypothetical protein
VRERFIHFARQVLPYESMRGRAVVESLRDCERIREAHQQPKSAAFVARETARGALLGGFARSCCADLGRALPDAID